MADDIVEYVEIWEGRQGGLQDAWKREYTRVFRARTTDALFGPLALILHPLTPRLFTPYHDAYGYADHGAVCYKVDPQQDQDDPFTWKVTASYTSDLKHLAELVRDGWEGPGSNQSFGGPSEGGNVNPLLRPPVITWGHNRYQRAITQDLNGTAIVNSAGDPFDPPIEIDDNRPTLSIKRNFASYNEQLAYRYYDAVNSDKWMGAEIGKWKVLTITGQSAWDNGLYYWEVTASFEYRRDGWNPLKVADVGFHQLVDGRSKLIYDLSTGQPYASPAQLDGFGLPLLPAHGLSNGQPQFRGFIVYPALPFAALGLL